MSEAPLTGVRMPATNIRFSDSVRFISEEVIKQSTIGCFEPGNVFQDLRRSRNPSITALTFLRC